LINAAVELFAEKGYFYTTTAEVSAQAGVAAGTLYLYFNSKDDLLVATLEAFLDEFSLNVMPVVYSASSPAEKLRMFVREYVAFVEDHRALAQVFLVELRQNNAALRNAASRVWERYTSIVRDLLADVRRQSAVTRFDMDAAVAMVLGALELTVVRWLLGHDVRPPRSHTAALTKVLLQAIDVSVEVEVP